MAQARGRSRRRKAGLQKLSGPPSDQANNEEIDRLNAEIISYLSEEFETLKQQPGMYKEVVAIGRALKQLRSPEPDHPEEVPPPPGEDPHRRDRFGLPSELAR